MAMLATHPFVPRRRSARLARIAAVAILVAVATVATVVAASSMRADGAAAPGSASSFVPITPCRLLDTRPGDINVGARATPLGAGATHTVAATGRSGSCDLPLTAVGLSMNIVAIGPTAASYLTVFPAGVDRPTSSSLNWVAGQAPTANAVTSALGTGGGLSLFNLAGSVDLAVDVVGYYVASSPPPAGPQGAPGATGPVGPTGPSSQPARVIDVAVSGGQFTSVAAALASITDASASNRYVIRIAPGVYTESSPLALKDYVDLHGAGTSATVLRSSSTTAAISAGNARSTLRSLRVDSTAGVGIRSSAGPDVLRLDDVSVTVTGGSTNIGLQTFGPLEADGLTVTATGTADVAAIDLRGDAQLTDVSLEVSGAFCFGVVVTDTTVISGLQTSVDGCRDAYAVFSEGDLTIVDSTIEVTGTASVAFGLTMGAGRLTARDVTIDVQGSGVSVAIYLRIGVAQITDSSASATNHSVYSDMSPDVEVIVSDTMLSGATTNMAGRCVDVWNSNLTAVTCT